MALPITNPKFVPKLDLSPDDLESLTVTGLGTSCTPALLKTGWKKLATANIGVGFASDNSRILTTNLFLLGKLHKSSTECTTVSAAKFWPGVNQNIEIRLPLDNLNVFPFDASLQSGLVSSSAVEHEIFDTEKDLPVSPEDFRAAGGGGFTLRAFTHMTAGSWMKLQIALYPLAKDKLLETFPYASNILFPGLLLTSKNITVLPNATKDYGYPFYPFLQKGRPDIPFPQMPSFDLRSKIASLLQTGVAPKLAKDATYLAAKWEKLKELKEKGEDSLTSSTTTAAIWPDALPSPGPQGDNSDLEGM